MNLMPLWTIKSLNMSRSRVIVTILTMLWLNACLGLSDSNDFPNVIGMHQTDAERILKGNNITYSISYGISEGSRERYIFDQKANGSMLNISVNKRLESLQIEDKMNIIILNLSSKNMGTVHTNSTVVVKGYLVSDLKKDQHIWIAVNPQTSVNNWWPQSNGVIIPYKREFKGNAFLGGATDQTFDIAVLIVNDTLNQTLADWEMHSAMEQSWPPITEGDPITGAKVSQNEIEDAVLVKVQAFLK